MTMMTCSEKKTINLITCVIKNNTHRGYLLFRAYWFNQAPIRSPSTRIYDSRSNFALTGAYNQRVPSMGCVQAMLSKRLITGNRRGGNFCFTVNPSKLS